MDRSAGTVIVVSDSDNPPACASTPGPPAAPVFGAAEAPGGDSGQAAERFAELYPEIYLLFHRRREKRSELTGASRAILLHLSLSGPLTVGEAAAHLDRAQSVVSEIVAHLSAKGLLERWADPRDRRRTLVWLTPNGLDLLERDREVLSLDRLTEAFAGMTPAEQDALLTGAAALFRAAGTSSSGASTDQRPITREDQS